MTGKKVANIVINNMLGHFNRAKRMPTKLDAEMFGELLAMVECNYVSENVFKDRELWQDILTMESPTRRSMMFKVFDSKHFTAREFFKDVASHLAEMHNSLMK